jgi:hypothetical protein
LKEKASQFLSGVFKSEGDSSRNLFLVSASALAVVGVSTIGYSILQSRSENKKKEEIFRTQRRARQSKAQQASNESEKVHPLLRRQQRRVTVYFDKNDEMVDEQTALRDPYNYYHKYHAVTLEFEGENHYDATAHKITKDIFNGEKKTENAQIFIKKIQEAKVLHQKKLINQEYFPHLQDSEDALSDIHLDKAADKFGEGAEDCLVLLGGEKGKADSALNESGLIMDVDPRKFEKPKDNLFFNFFSIYTNNFIEEKGAAQSQKQLQALNKLRLKLKQEDNSLNESITE